MGESVITDVWEANFKLDEQRRVIAEVARRCRLKGRNYQCSDCPMATGCKVDEQLQYLEEELKHASPY